MFLGRFNSKFVFCILFFSIIISNVTSQATFASDSPNNGSNKVSDDTTLSSRLQSSQGSQSSSNLVDAQKLQEALQKKNEQLTSELNLAKSDASNLERQKQIYKEKINVLQQQIDFTNVTIRTLDSDIKARQEDINKKREQINKNSEKLTAMIRTFYISGESYNIDMLMDSKSFSDFLDRADMVKTVGEYYLQLVDTLKIQKDQIEDEKLQKELMLKNLEQSKKELIEKQAELTNILAENESLLKLFNDDQEYIQKKIDSNNAAMKEIDSKIANYYSSKKSEQTKTYNSTPNSIPNSASNSVSSSSPTKSSSMLEWPTPGFTYISSYWGDGRDHKGIDIAGAGIYGTPIIAAADGVVGISNSGNYGGGYGNYVMIDHGNNFATLYGHMSEIIVSEGQTVKRGDTIGYVGSTGDSTGPHLHFEVLVDNKRCNPFDYLG